MSKVLTQEECTGMIGAVGKGRTAVRNRALLVLLWRTGLRISEALALLPSDVDDRAKTVHVFRGKGDKTRTVPVPPGALATVREYKQARKLYELRRGSPLFCTLVGTALSPRYVQYLVKRLAERAGIDKRVHPHMLRHTYAATLMREGANPRLIQENMGHANLQVTTDYLSEIGALPEAAAFAAQQTPWDAEDPNVVRGVGIGIAVRGAR